MIFDNLVHNRADHIGAQKIGRGAYGGKDTHQNQQDFVLPQIGEEGMEGMFQILRSFSAKCSRHDEFLLSSENSKFPDKWDRMPEDPGAFPQRESVRRQE